MLKKQKTYTIFVLLNNTFFLHYHIGEMAEHSTKMLTNEFITFGDFKITKMEFHCSKNEIPIDDTDAEKTFGILHWI